MNTADKLAALREAATPGPWTAPEYAHLAIWAPSKRFRDARTVVCLMPEADGAGRHRTDPDGDADAALIVALVNAAPALEALVRAAELPHAFEVEHTQVQVNGHLEDVIGIPRSEALALAAALAELCKVL